MNQLVSTPFLQPGCCSGCLPLCIEHDWVSSGSVFAAWRFLLSLGIFLGLLAAWRLLLSLGYTYRKSIQLAKNVKLPTTVSGCDCKGSCVDPRICACAKRNDTDFPYVHRNGGRLIEAKDVVYECGPNCGCGPGCVNRTSQRGLRYRLEVFRTPKKGWAVRSWNFIPAGAPVCEYTGADEDRRRRSFVRELLYL